MRRCGTHSQSQPQLPAAAISRLLLRRPVRCELHPALQQTADSLPNPRHQNTRPRLFATQSRMEEALCRFPVESYLAGDGASPQPSSQSPRSLTHIIVDSKGCQLPISALTPQPRSLVAMTTPTLTWQKVQDYGLSETDVTTWLKKTFREITDVKTFKLEVSFSIVSSNAMT